MSERRRGGPRKVLIRLGLLLAGLLAAEVAVRLVMLVAGSPYGVAAVEEELRAIRDAFGVRPDVRAVEGGGNEGVGEHAFLHPFYGYETNQGFGSVAHQYDFMRSEKWTSLAPEKRPYVILIVGGSVAQLFGGRGRGGTDRLGELLKADPRFAGREVYFMSEGRPVFRQPQQLMLVSYLLNLGFQPDAVVNLDGFNEAAFGMQNASYGVNPTFPSFHHIAELVNAGGDARGRELELAVWAAERRARSFIGMALNWRLARSAMLGALVRSHARDLRGQWNAASRIHAAWLASAEGQEGIRGIPFDPSEEAVVDLTVGSWIRASRALNAICREQGVFYLHVMQPTLYDRGSKPLAESEVPLTEPAPEALPAARGVELTYPRMKAAADILRGHGIAFEDATDVFAGVEQPLYYDFCHFTREGNQILAERIAAAFLRGLP